MKATSPRPRPDRLCPPRLKSDSLSIEEKIRELLQQMTLEEKIGQLWQANGSDHDVHHRIRTGQTGSVINATSEAIPEFQRIAREESRLGIPLLIGRDVIHGFKTILPIPLGQAATWNPDIVREGARIAAHEASATGINWTFAPMVDISRDPRWGRIAESCGEDPLLSGVMGAAMVEGFQGCPASENALSREIARSRLHEPGSIAACVKHYVGYGAAEGGRDYNTTLIPERTLRNVYLPPFLRCVESGAVTVMSAFNEINDIPASGNVFNLRQVLKSEWQFDGMVVSDWASITEMIVHGYCADEQEAAYKALRAGVDMEMVTRSYPEHLAKLVESGRLPEDGIDDAVLRVLRVKATLGLFSESGVSPSPQSVISSEAHLETARQAASESCVLLKNDGLLPLTGCPTMAVIGPLSASGVDQLGCWALDGDSGIAINVVDGFRALLGADCVMTHPGMSDIRSHDTSQVADAVAVARKANVVILVLGEDARLTGESHCRSHLGLPGAQQALLQAVADTGTPVITVILAGRPLILRNVLPFSHALLWAWHPGTMGGLAIAELLLGHKEPVGRLPVTFPRAVGQIPIYYNHKRTGRPPHPEARDEPEGTPLDPVGFSSRYMDLEVPPQFPFGYGLGYTTFSFDAPSAPTAARAQDGITVKTTVKNTGRQRGTTVAQLYLRFLHGEITRPVRELKAFRRVTLDAGESFRVQFHLSTDDLACFDSDMQWTVECVPVEFWIAPDATCQDIPPVCVRFTE